MRNWPAKITAMCTGLAVCSLVLFVGKCAALDAYVPGLMFDDVFFGRRWPLVSTYFLIDALIMAGVVVLLPRRPVAATAVGFVWTSWLLVESVCDLPAFAHDPHMLAEEAAFVGIYAVLLVQFAGHWRGLCSCKIRDRAQRVVRAAARM